MRLTRLDALGESRQRDAERGEKDREGEPLQEPELCVGDLKVDLDRLPERHDDHPVYEVKRVDEHEERENRAPVGALELRDLRHLTSLHCGRQAFVTGILPATYSLREPR